MPLPIYLDYAATTPVDPRVADRMSQWLTAEGAFGNPSSHTHVYGRLASQAVAAAREQVAALVNAAADEIVWTSGATEANNLALKGAAHYYRNRKKGRHLVTCKTEHRAVLDVCRQLQREGFEVTYLDPEPTGLVDPDRLAAALRDDTLLVSLMHVNNETGVLQDVTALGRLVRERGALFHVDAAQSAGKIPIDLAALPVDLLSLSAHKIYGPKGIGALYVRGRPQVRLEPQLHGGGQERGVRAGTLATHQIAGMGEACRIARAAMAADNSHLLELRERLWQGIQVLEEVHLNGDPDRRVAGILNVSFSDVDGEALRMAMPGVAVSSGSACASAATEPSHVLRALGLDSLLARSAIRFSLGRFTTRQDIEVALAQLEAALTRLRELSPLWELRLAGLDPRGLIGAAH